MSPIRPGLCAVALAVSLARAASAQESPLVVEVHGGAAIPIGSFANGDGVGGGASSGASFGVDVALPGGGRVAPYVGFSQHRFGCEDAGCDPDGRYVATGFQGGIRIVPLPGRSVLPWVRLGAVTTHVETNALAGAAAGVTDLGMGGEVGAGVHLGRGSQLALNPGVRLVAVNANLPDGSTLRLRYLVADLAVVLSF